MDTVSVALMAKYTILQLRYVSVPKKLSSTATEYAYLDAGTFKVSTPILNPASAARALEDSKANASFVLLGPSSIARDSVTIVLSISKSLMGGVSAREAMWRLRVLA
jgi:hypothetical protein